MAEIFDHKEAQNVLEHKHIALLGGSNMRGLYKDMIWLLNDSSMIPYEVIGEKMEKNFPSFEGPKWEKSRLKISKRLRKIFNKDNCDNLLRAEGVHPGRNYVEPRTYHHAKKDVTISFLFTTRVWHEELEEFFRGYEEDHGAKLDIIIMNSVLWDTNRWGPFYVKNYKENFEKLITTLKETLSENGHFIWLTNQPGSKYLNSKAMEIPGLQFQKITTRYNVIEANFFAAHKVAEAGYSVIDLHYYFLLQTFRRNRDGIHWSPEANRYVSNLVLTHISLKENKPLPGRNQKDYALERVILINDIEKGKYQIDGKIQNDKIRQQLKKLEVIAKGLINNNSGRSDLPPVQRLLQTAREKIAKTNPDQDQQRAGVFRPTRGPGPRFDPYPRGGPRRGPPMPPPPAMATLQNAYDRWQNPMHFGGGGPPMNPNHRGLPMGHPYGPGPSPMHHPSHQFPHQMDFPPMQNFNPNQQMNDFQNYYNN